MAPEEKLTLTQTSFETIDKHDFVPPQASVDPARPGGRQEMEVTQTYILQQASPTIQNLVPSCKAKGPSYTIRLDKVGSFLKPQPHIFITENPEGLHVAEVKLQNQVYDATMIYKNAGTSHKFVLQNTQDQIFQLLVNGEPHRWHPLGPSKSVFELTQGADKRVALFSYAEGLAQRTASASGSHEAFREQKIGEVHVVEDLTDVPIALQLVLFSAVVVVEQLKRRATSMITWVASPASKAHYPGRRRSGDEDAGGNRYED